METKTIKISLLLMQTTSNPQHQQNLILILMILEGRKFKRLTLLKTKSLRKFSIFNILITADNQELGSPFHPFAVKTHTNCVMHVSSTLIPKNFGR